MNTDLKSSPILRRTNLVEVPDQCERCDRVDSESELRGGGQSSTNLLLGSGQQKRFSGQRSFPQLHSHPRLCGCLPLHCNRSWREGGGVFQGLRHHHFRPIPLSPSHGRRGGRRRGSIGLQLGHRAAPRGSCLAPIGEATPLPRAPAF